MFFKTNERKSRRPSAFRFSSLLLIAMLAGPAAMLTSCSFGGEGSDVKTSIGTTSKKLALLVDRLGPIIMSSQGLRGELISNILTASTKDGQSALNVRLDRILKDDAAAASFARNLLTSQWEPYPGKDGTFLGQWDIPQNDETLDAFVRSQIKPVGDQPSPEANAWIRDNVVQVLQDRFKVDLSDPIIRDALGPELLPVTPGLGS